ncbi:DegT/DnrJ/EryC1/StrS family aminotransferase [Algoriphagus aestuarii]|nr:DegT/DnrJ/EryC1/StrS family aminotransferase [Algoriphagus aestuarii]
MKVPFLDLSRMEESLKAALKTKFDEILENGRFSGGEEVEDFEQRVSEYLGFTKAIACANGTDALELALRALNIGPGDEVIVPALTWVSTAEVVKMVGATPIFWDTDEWGLLKSDWEKAITPKTKAVIPVHLYGKMVDMESLMTGSKNQELFVVEDAAQAFGSFQKGKGAGTWSDVGCLSFYPTKNLGALGEAGMCLTNNVHIEKKIRLLLNHGQPTRDQHELIGRNSRIDTLQAGFLNVQLDYFKANLDLRKKYAGLYFEGLNHLKEIKLPIGILKEDHNAHLFVIQSKKRDSLQKFLVENGIGTAIHYPQILPDLEPFRCKGKFQNARRISQEGLSLPLNPWMKRNEIDFVIQKICEFFEK